MAQRRSKQGLEKKLSSGFAAMQVLTTYSVLWTSDSRFPWSAEHFFPLEKDILSSWATTPSTGPGWKWKCYSLSRVWLFVTPWTVAHQAPVSMEFSRQEYWSGLPLPSPGDLPDTEIEPRSPTLQADSLLSKPPGNLFFIKLWCFKHLYLILSINNRMKWN